MAPRGNKSTIDRILDSVIGPLDDEAPVVPKKRTRGPGKKNKLAVAQGTADDALPIPTNKPAKITYTINCFTVAQMRKAEKKRGEPAGSTVLQLSDTEPWDTMQAQLLVKISSVLKPSILSFENYRVSFVIPRLVKNPTRLEDNDSYLFMIDRALKSQDPVAMLIVEPVIQGKKSSEKENDEERSSESGSDESSGSEPKAKKRKTGKGKSKKKDPMDLPGNKAVAKEITILRERWNCQTPSCASEHCFVHPDEDRHIPLSHTQFKTWAAAIVKADGSATITKPPNHPSFDFLPSNSLGRPSTLLQRRLTAQNQASTSQASPVVNVNMPNDIFGFLHRGQPPITPTPLVPLAHMPLVPAACKSIESLPLLEFCLQYHLSDNISTQLAKEGFTSSNQLRFLQIGELKEMGFLRGEIAVLQDAAQVHWGAAAL